MEIEKFFELLWLIETFVTLHSWICREFIFISRNVFESRVYYFLSIFSKYQIDMRKKERKGKQKSKLPFLQDRFSHLYIFSNVFLPSVFDFFQIFFYKHSLSTVSMY